MYPTLESGDYVLGSRRLQPPQRGEVVTYVSPANPGARIGRVIALSGDTVEIVQNQITLNGKPLAIERTEDSCEDSSPCVIWRETLGNKAYRIATAPSRPLRAIGPLVVPEGEVFLLGDNRDNSNDSRFVGSVPVELVQSTLRFIYFSWNGAHVRWDRIHQVVH